MDNLMQVKGELVVSLGEGYLSLHEACTLRSGNVVRSRNRAGAPHALLYNGTPLAQCEVVVLDAQGGGSVWGVRVSDTDFPGTYTFGPCRKDEVGELVPFMIRLGSIRASLSELGGVARNSIISLGRPWSEDSDADLVVAGILLARGKVVVIDEEMGLRITQTLGEPCATEVMGSSGYVLDGAGQDGRVIKDYDFRRPDKVTKTLIDRMRDIHTLFLRNLRARSPGLADALGQRADPVVDQCTLGEAWAALDKGGALGRLVVENRAWRSVPGNAVVSVLPVRPILEEAGTAHPLDAGLLTRMEKHLGQQGHVSRNVLFVAHPKTVGVEGAEQSAFLASLRDAWRNYADLNLAALPGAGPSDTGMQENEMVVTVVFEAGRGVALALVYPYLTLEPFVRVLSM